jgi:Zn finger protein HypA/HybF involved in hydrogenase expression
MTKVKKKPKKCWCENMPIGGLEFAKKEIKAVFSADLNFCPKCGKKL